MNIPRWAALALAASVTLVACEGDDEARRANQPPDTAITASPPQQTPTGARVSLAWEGTDDREVAAFEWRLSDNGADGTVDEADTLGLAWNFTTVWDTTITVSADLDSFPGDLVKWAVDEEHPRFWQTHTFFVRAIDDYGVRDPEPAMASFTAVTLAPTVVLDEPPYLPSSICSPASLMMTLGWAPEDPDGIEDTPLDVRVLQLRVGGPDDLCYTQLQYEQSDPLGEVAPDDPAWSDWIAYDSTDPASWHMTLGPFEVGSKYLLAVQARDAAGAVTPTFEWGVNVRHVKAGTNKYALLWIEEDLLGREGFVSVNEIQEKELLEGPSLTFRWGATAVEYGGRIEAFRHGWNVEDPDDPFDPGWLGDWAAPGGEQSYTTGPLSHGGYTFVVACRDDSGTVSRGFYRLHAILIPERTNRQDLLLVDDWPLGTTQVEAQLEAAWDAAWEQLLLSAGLPPARWDVLDVQESGGELTVERLLQYKAVIWFSNASDLTFLHTRLAPRFFEETYSWLEDYQCRGGNLLLVGPGVAYNSLEREPPIWEFPIVFEEDPEASREASTDRWPWRGFGLSALSLVRPAWETITGENLPSNMLRNLDCDAMVQALLDPAFDAVGPVDLRPTQPRLLLTANYELNFEEFYDTDASLRGVTLMPRSELTVMFRLLARRDDPTLGIELDPCPQPDLERSPLDGAPVGIMSTAYSDTKPWPDTADFLWGFHPLAFEPEDVAKALRWIFEENWRLDE